MFSIYETLGLYCHDHLYRNNASTMPSAPHTQSQYHTLWICRRKFPNVLLPHLTMCPIPPPPLIRLQILLGVTTSLCGRDLSAMFTHHRFGIAKADTVKVALSNDMLEKGVDGHGPISGLGIGGDGAVGRDAEALQVGSEVH
jgi:hypothetical protein